MASFQFYNESAAHFEGVLIKGAVGKPLQSIFSFTSLNSFMTKKERIENAEKQLTETSIQG